MSRLRIDSIPLDLMTLDQLRHDLKGAAKILGMSRRALAQKIYNKEIVFANISSGKVPRYRFSDRMLLDYLKSITTDARNEISKRKDKQGLTIVAKTPGFDELEKQAKKGVKKKAKPRKRKL